MLGLSSIAFGTWRIKDDATARTPQGLAALFHAAIEVGITTIDTAEIYGGYTVEALIGEAFKTDPGLKKQVQVVTKAGIYIPLPSIPTRTVAHYDSSAVRLVASVQASLKLMGLDLLDVFLVHRPDWFTAHEDTAKGLKTILERGYAKAVGVSNYTTTQFSTLTQFLGKAPCTNQVQFSPFHIDPILDGTFDVCQAAGIRPMAWSPTGGGKLFKPDESAAIRVRTVMEAMAPRYGNAAVDTLCHAWVMNHPTKPISVLGTTKVERIQTAAAAMSLTLSREDWFTIAEAARGIRIP